MYDVDVCSRDQSIRFNTLDSTHPLEIMQLIKHAFAVSQDVSNILTDVLKQLTCDFVKNLTLTDVNTEPFTSSHAEAAVLHPYIH